MADGGTHYMSIGGGHGGGKKKALYIYIHMEVGPLWVVSKSGFFV